MNYSEFVHSRFKDGGRLIGDLQGMTAEASGAAMSRLHAAVGMVGEIRELRDTTGAENTIEELGDFLFYLQAYTNTLGDAAFDNALVSNNKSTIDDLDIAAHTLLDLAKKETIYCKAFDAPKAVQITTLLWTIAGAYADLSTGLFVGEIMDENQAKLEKRFPLGYSNAAAQARADKAGE